METTVINGTEYRDVPLALLNESKTNPRRIFEDAALKELADFVPLCVLLPRLLNIAFTEHISYRWGT